ncbi:cation channel sperm-associated auxiliary subunit epsilon isoform X2 [Alligator mississippiensis]|uniref:cation channel sperm-associated auxiliary subunit epsilon isoform X2 n=1 Tax=Alligator mississippiensis TaxID=8496 RepID=UPI002877A985|nr:cation channel sperm-associated auxiliary subunit epsilon isoform X2 [Alligator mississippiensis]
MGAALLVLLLLWWGGACAFALWRYRTPEGTYVLFTTRTTVFLEYEGELFLSWNIPVVCTIANESSPTTTLKCQISGSHRLEPILDTEELEYSDRFIPFAKDLNCFLWYVVTNSTWNSSVPPSNNDTQVLTLWIYDPENAIPSELDHSATSPSANSRILSKHFWNLGQEPVVETHLRNTKYFADEFTDLGLWKIKVPANSDDIITIIRGKAIAFQDCFVQDTPYILSRPEQPFFNNANDISLSSPAGSDIYIVWSACFPTTALVLTDFGTFHTNDGFRTSKEIKAPSHILASNLAQNVTAVALADDGILFLINGNIYKRESNDFFKLGTDYDLSEGDIIGVQSRVWCPSEYPMKSGRKLSTTAIWTSTDVHLGYGDNVFIRITDTSKLQKILGFPEDVSLSLGTVSYDSCPAEIALLVACIGCSSSRMFYVVTYNEDRYIWVLRNFFLSAPSKGFMKMEFMYSALPSMLLWNKTSMYYSYRNNTAYGFPPVHETNVTPAEYTNGSSIHQIVIDYSGNIVIKMQNNIMFFFKFDLIDVILLPRWENESKNTVLYLNPSGNLYIVVINSSGIHRQNYPLKMEVHGTSYSLFDECPYLAFHHNIDLNVYYLDKGDEVTFWAQILFQENLGLFVDVRIHRPELLEQATHVEYEIAHEICTKNQTITFYQNVDYSESLDYMKTVHETTGVMTVEVRPSMTGRACSTVRKLSYLFVGCPPSRHIVIQKPPGITCIKHNFTSYKLPGNFLWHSSPKDTVADYDWDKYGCLMEVYYRDPFRPEIALYDGNTFVKMVEANYILWEIKGRTDFGYNSSMGDVGCSREAQNWFSLLENHKNQEIELDDIWGPQNYNSCFEFSHKNLQDLSQQYHILNHSGSNSLIWNTEQSGIYVFKVKILDPNFSFCDLKTFFAVHTYGIVESPDIAKTIMFSIFVLSLFLGILVLSYFKYARIFQTLRYIDPLPSPGLQNHTKESSQGLKKDQ